MTTRVFLLAAILCAASQSAFADAATEFKALLDEHWEWTLNNSPVMASAMGDRRRNQDWADMSLDAI